MTLVATVSSSDIRLVGGCGDEGAVAHLKTEPRASSPASVQLVC